MDVCVAVGVGVCDRVGGRVDVSVAVWVGVDEKEAVGEGDRVLVGVDEVRGVAVGVAIRVPVAVIVWVAVTVADKAGVGVQGIANVENRSLRIGTKSRSVRSRSLKKSASVQPRNFV